MKTTKATSLLFLLASLALAGCSSTLRSSPTTPTSASAALAIAPNSAPAGSPDIQLSISGFGFSNGPLKSTAIWSENGSGGNVFLATTFVSKTQLTAVVPAALLRNPGSAEVFVETADSAGDLSPDQGPPAASFSILPPSGVGTFVPTASMRDARSSHTATLLADGKVLLAGGMGASDNLASAELYDPYTASFSPTRGSMSQAREAHCAVLLEDGRVLVAGGESSTTVLKGTEVFDPATEIFSRISDMNNPRSGSTCTLLRNGKVLIAGGSGNQGSLASAELFDPASDTFTPIPDMTFPRTGHTASLLADGRVLLVGGIGSSGVQSSAEIFDPVNNTFTITSPMALARAGHSATVLTNGQVLVLGGRRGLFSSPQAQFFDPPSGAFLDAGHLLEAREEHTATPLPSGEVLVAGGMQRFSGDDAPEQKVLSSAELYAPDSKASIAVGSLETQRAGHTATLLNDGSVLVAGGSNGKGAALASCELYK